MASISMRTGLGLTIVLMGLLGMALAVATGAIYRDLALERQRASLVDLIKLKTDDLLAKLEESSVQLGGDMQREDTFRVAFAAKDGEAVRYLLNSEFHRYFETANVIKLAKLYVFDADFSLFSESSDPASLPVTATGKLVCGALIGQARRRTGAARLKPLSEICLHNGRPYHAVMVPIGGLRATGYIEVITDPAQNLMRLESELGMPVRLLLVNGGIYHVSPKWPTPGAMREMLVADYRLKTPVAEHALTISMVNDIQSLHHDLEKARNTVLFVAAATTLLAAIMTLFIMQKTMLAPLNLLIGQMRRVRKDKSQLGAQVVLAGVSEVRELAEDFNAMTAELGDLHNTLEKMAFNDALTGLPNRSLFNDRLNQIVLVSQRRNARFALFMMDLDRFKQINDTLGHAAGDELLRQVSARLLGVLRKSDMIARIHDDSMLARLGGDEFAAILPMVGKADYAAMAAKRIQNALEPPFDIGGSSFNIGISIGIAIYPEDGADEDTLVRRADTAMYQAKRNQRGIAFHDSEQDESSMLQLTLESELRAAMEHDGLELYFQPKMDMGSGMVCGAEALLRWRHPERGFVPPDTFIPLAEQTGLIHPLTQWVLDKAVEQCALWHRAGFPIGVSVNLSARSLRDPRIIDHVAKALQQWSMAPQHLCLELAGSAIVAEPEQALKILAQLDAMGVKLSIDDFGAACSSLACLKKQPVDEVKIDKSFVAGMASGNSDTVIVHSTINLAHNMNLKVVAEGVENRGILELLTSLHCDVAQGYYLGHPLPGPEFFRHLCEGQWPTTSTDVEG